MTKFIVLVLLRLSTYNLQQCYPNCVLWKAGVAQVILSGFHKPALFKVKSVNIFLMTLNCICRFSSTFVCIIDSLFSLCNSPVTKFRFLYTCATFLFLWVKGNSLKKFFCAVPSIKLSLCTCSAEYLCDISHMFTVDLKWIQWCRYVKW